jgi:predicted CopG family antitoxin
MELIFMEYTTIQIRKETREKLKKLRITKRETYDEIINRLMKKCK